MIKIDNIEVFNFRGAIRGMRNPLNSWDKSDSKYSVFNFNDCEVDCVVGNNDLVLMNKLYTAGSEHRKFARQIFVSIDITAPLYWISEFDTYKVGTTRNSCSFMHKGVSKPFEITDFSIHDERVYDVLSDYDKQISPLVYKYPTDDYKIYTCSNGRKYKIYKNGKVFACEFEYFDSMGRHRVFSEKECKPSVSHGYYEIRLGGRSGERWLLHRLVATVWIPNVDALDTVNHIDGNKGNNCVENLEWISLADNIRKGFEIGLYSQGKSLHARYQKWKNGHTVVEPHIKSQILREHNNGLTCKDLAEKYDITASQANNLISTIPCNENELFQLCYTWENAINTLNQLREEYLESNDSSIFQQIRCLLPSGYNQTFTVTMSYENVFNIIKQRTNHKLDEWNTLVKVLKDLPYVREIMGE